MKQLKIAAALCAATMLLGGCSGLEPGFEDILRPPKAMGDEAEIEKLISDAAGTGYTLKYPKSGSYRSAIIMYDLDGDDTDEAIAFFKGKDDLTNVRMLIMSDGSDGWKVSGDFSTETTDVERVDFADIDDSDGAEIIVGYTTYTPNVNFLSCYTYKGGSTGIIKSGQNYSAFCCGNLDGVGKREIIALSLFNAETEARASMLTYNAESKTLYSKANTALDPNVIKYRKAVFSDLQDGTKALVIDGAFADETLSTQVIYYNRELAILRNPLYREKEKSVTRRAGLVLSNDIDNDGNVEIPIVDKLPYSGAEGVKVVADKLTWYNFSAENESLVLKTSAAANFKLSYSVRIPETWEDDSFTATLGSADNTMTFYEWQGDRLGKELFRIKAFPVAQWDLGKENEGYSLIYRDAKYAFSFRNAEPDSPLALSDDKIKTSFSVLDGAYE